MMKQFILIPQLKLQNANALSSPYTIGFPAITAWLGAAHALQRKIQATNPKFNMLNFSGVAISCHTLDLQVHKGKSDFVNSIVGTANPLAKDGARSAFIEEARCHLTVSLLIEVTGVDANDWDEVCQLMNNLIPTMRFASGTVISCRKVEQHTVGIDDTAGIKKLMNKLMLGYVIIDRRDLVLNDMQTGKDALESVLDHQKITQQAQLNENNAVTWQATRLAKGWIVPIAVGFQGVSALQLANHQRDATTPHQFAESVITLGEFVMPHRIDHFEHVLWRYHTDKAAQLYVCQTELLNP